MPRHFRSERFFFFHYPFYRTLTHFLSQLTLTRLLSVKVAGNFHVALGKSKSVDGRLIHEFNPSEAEHFNTSHRINFLSFGPPVPGVVNPMDGMLRMVDARKSSTAVYQYFIKIVNLCSESTIAGENHLAYR